MCLLGWAVYNRPSLSPSLGFTHFNGLLSDDFKRSPPLAYASVCLALILILISACGFCWPKESFAVACRLPCDLCSPLPPVLRLCLSAVTLLQSHDNWSAPSFRLDSSRHWFGDFKWLSP